MYYLYFSLPTKNIVILLKVSHLLVITWGCLINVFNHEGLKVLTKDTKYISLICNTLRPLCYPLCPLWLSIF